MAKKKTTTKSSKKASPKMIDTHKFSKTIEDMKSTKILVFVACAEDGKLKADKKTADEFEVLSKSDIQKVGMKLVKQGLFNVNDGVFTLSKHGRSHVVVKKQRRK